MRIAAAIGISVGGGIGGGKEGGVARTERIQVKIYILYM